MKKVLFIVPSLSKGGAERVVSNLSKGLSDEWEKYIAVFDGSRIDYDYEGELIEMDVSSETNRILRDCRGLKELKKIKEEIDPAVSVSFLPEPNLINILSRRKDEKTVISVRNMLSRTVEQPGLPYSFLSKIMIKSLYNKANKIVALSRGVKHDLIENFKAEEEKVEVIYNPCDVEEIKKISKEEIPDEERDIFENPTVINVASLTEQKGHWRLLRSFKKVKNEVPDSQLVILGEGELEEDLKQLTKDLEIKNNVHFLGFKDNPFKYMKQSDVFALSSIFEGLGNVIIEALACETPVVSTDCKSGPREILCPKLDIDEKIKYPYQSDYGKLTEPLENNAFFKNLKTESLSKSEKILSKGITKTLNKENFKDSNLVDRSKDFNTDKIINKWEGVLK